MVKIISLLRKLRSSPKMYIMGSKISVVDGKHTVRVMYTKGGVLH